MSVLEHQPTVLGYILQKLLTNVDKPSILLNHHIYTNHLGILTDCEVSHHFRNGKPLSFTINFQI